MADIDYADDLALLTNIPARAEYQLYIQEPAAESIGFYVNTNKRECICFKQKGVASF